MYQNRCPQCGEQLYLDTCRVTSAYGVVITEYGFSLNDADALNTSDETVVCPKCGYTGPLEEAEDLGTDPEPGAPLGCDPAS